MPFHDYGENWGTDARSRGYVVDTNPAIGSVAWKQTGSIVTGHVAWVEDVSGNNVTVEQYNADFHGHYSFETEPKSNFTDFIHFKDLGVTLSDGSLVNYAGNVYRMAGGAPIYVSTWNAVGGPQPSTSLTDAQWDSLPQYPRDGTYLLAGRDVFVTAGGAPVYVSNWNSVGGPHATIQIDPAAIGEAGLGGVWNHLRQYPADGTFVSGGGYVYKMAGGAPIYVSSWSAVGGPQPSAGIDPAAIAYAGAGGVWNHLRQYPADGTLVNGNGHVYVVAGGAPIYVSSWSSIGGPQPQVQIDEAAIDAAGIGFPWNHLRQQPADGTFVITLSGAVYRIAGGAAIHIDTWAPYGGTQPTTLIDAAAINSAGIGYPWNHLLPKPADGTIIEGLPSNGFWKIVGGKRSAVAPPQPSAVGLPDDALFNFPALSPPPTINAFSPASTGVGATVTIGGSNLATTSQISFNGTVATTFHVVSASALTAVVPAGATSGHISLIAAGGKATSNATLTIIPAPSIASLSTASATPGTQVTITGSHFTGVSPVAFNGVAASFHFISDSSLTAIVPSTATSGPLTVTTPGGTSSASFTVLPYPPSVISFTPGHGPVGTKVTVSGLHFTGATAVKFNGVAATVFRVVSDGTITVTVPNGATTGKVSVVSAGGTAASSASYTVG